MKKMRASKIILLAAMIGALLIPAAPARAQSKTVTIEGGGFGHGLGMSQYGALGRAQRGKSAEQILEHYYTGAEVSNRASSGTIKVGLIPNYGGNQGSLSFTTEPFGTGSGDVSIKVKGEKDDLVQGHAGDTFLVEASSTGGLRIKKNGKAVERGGKTVFGIDSGLIVHYQKHGSALKPTGKAHRYVYGKGEIGTYKSDASACEEYCIQLALALGMQKYLYGLGEVPSSWPDAALKAQAIAGRTFAFDRVLTVTPSTRACGCHVYDSTIDQAYIGDSKRTGSGDYWDDWKGAVDNTKDLVATYEGDVLGDALYSSSSGGHTESNENVWGGSPVPYLRGVRDGADKANGENERYRWTKTIPWSEFQSMLSSYGVGEVEDIEIVKRGDSRRIAIDGARLVGSEKSTLVDGWSLRGSLSLYDSLVFKIDMGSAVGERFRSKYNKLDGAPGAAKSGPYDVPRGWKQPRGEAQDFSSGRMTYIKETGKVVWQHGPILKAYDSYGRESSKLGMPASGVWDGPGFRAGTYAGGRLIKPKGASPIPVLGAFEDAFVRNGGVAVLGLPLGKRSGADGLPDGGRRQRFEQGTLYKSGSGGGVYALFREIDVRYTEIGEAGSDCGYPTGDMVEDGETWVATFEHGTMVLKASGKINVSCG